MSEFLQQIINGLSLGAIYALIALGYTMVYGILRFINQTHFDRITMILRPAGFVTSDLIGGQNAVNFAYILYLRGRVEKTPAVEDKHDQDYQRSKPIQVIAPWAVRFSLHK